MLATPDERGFTLCERGTDAVRACAVLAVDEARCQLNVIQSRQETRV
jgi:hypothetical protein